MMVSGSGTSRRVLPLLLLIPAVACDVPTAPPRIESTWRFPTEPVEIPVTGVMASASSTEDLSDFDLADRVRSAVIFVSPVNPTNASGAVSFTISGGGVIVQSPIDVRGAADQAIPLSRSEVQAFLGGTVTLRAEGTLCLAGGCGLVNPPFPVVTLETKLEVVVEVGGEG